LGFRVKGFWFRSSYLWFRVSGFGFRVSGSGIRDGIVPRDVCIVRRVYLGIHLLATPLEGSGFMGGIRVQREYLFRANTCSEGIPVQREYLHGGVQG